MSQALLHLPAAASSASSPGWRRVLRILLVVAALSMIGGLLTTTMFMRNVAVADVQPAAPVPFARPIVSLTGNTSVPDASSALSGRAFEPDSPVPTF